jgi:hypothetical protein
MLGFADWGVASAYLATLGATALCVVYGVVNWNEPGAEEEKKEILEEEAWEQNEGAAR